MLYEVIEIITSLRDVLILLLGALIAALASIVIWRLQLREQNRRERAKMLLKPIQLAICSSTHTRSIIYSKIEGLKAVADLPDNPVDELTAITLIYFQNVYSMAKRLHLQQQDLFAYSIGSPDAAKIMTGMGEAMAETITNMVKQLMEIAEKENLAV